MSPSVSLHQDWDAHLKLQDSKWGQPAGPALWANGMPLASATDWQETVALNQWHTLHLSYDGDQTVRCWIDGTLIAQQDSAPNRSRRQDWMLRLGGFDGDIDEVRISNSNRPVYTAQ